LLLLLHYYGVQNEVQKQLKDKRKATLISGFFVGVRLVLTSRLMLAMQLHNQEQHKQTRLTLG